MTTIEERLPGICRLRRTPARCRPMSVQAAVASRSSCLTTRLTAAPDTPLNLDRLRYGSLVKGLFVAKDADCPEARPLIVLCRPDHNPAKLDFHHIDIARQLRLTDRDKAPATLLNEFPREIMAAGVYGFTLRQAVFNASTDFSRTHLDLPEGGDEALKITVNPNRDPGLIDPDSGKVVLADIGKIIDERAAIALTEKYICGLMFRSDRTLDNEIWAVIARSGGAGPIPQEQLPDFLQALAKHIAPDFRLFLLPGRQSAYQASEVQVSREDAAFPNCAHWAGGNTTALADCLKF